MPMLYRKNQKNELVRRDGNKPVLFLLNALEIGGSERKIISVVNELHKRGCDVHLAYLDDRTSLLGTLNEYVSLVHLKRSGRFSVRSVLLLRDYLQQNGIETIVSVSLYPLIYAASAAWLLGHQRMPKLVAMVNTTYHVNIKEKLQMLLYGHILRRADKIVFGCNFQMDLWRLHYRLSADRCSVIYNGIDTEKFRPITNTVERMDVLVSSSPGLIIGSVGQLRPEKNYLVLIEAVGILANTNPNVRLVIAGDGPEMARLQQAAADFGITHLITLSGEVQDVRQILQSMDIFVLPSLSETFSNAAIEAMAVGKSVILSDTGGMSELIEDGVSGFLYEQGNLDSLICLIRMLALDANRRIEVGRRARERVCDKFSFDRMADDYVEMLS